LSFFGPAIPLISYTFKKKEKRQIQINKVRNVHSRCPKRGFIIIGFRDPALVRRTHIIMNNIMHNKWVFIEDAKK